MEKLSERFDSVQEALLSLYEKGATDLESHVQYWDLVRQENVLMHYARQKGLLRIGMQQLPALAVTENNAKTAIKMKLLLQSLQQSPFGNEPWTLSEVSIELYNTEPKYTFKKQGETVTVLYDESEDKEFPYVSWKHIYYQNDNDEWRKTKGQVDYSGLFYITENGDKIYYVNFEDDAQRYGESGQWLVKYKTQTISASVTSSSRRQHLPPSNPALHRPATSATNKTPEKRRREDGDNNQATPRKRERLGSGSRQRERGSERSEPRPRRGRSGGGPTVVEEEADSSTELGVPTPGEVGSRNKSPGGHYPSRVARLQAEAWDPPVVLLKGQQNVLKCFRNRAKQRHHRSFTYMSTVFTWVNLSTEHAGGRMLIAFDSAAQRQTFLDTVTFPTGTRWALGSLESL